MVMPERYVSATNVINILSQFYNYTDAERYELALAISAIPPADVVERKRGKWILNRDGNWACPFCEFDPYHDNMKGMNYCPNCGAYLRKGGAE